MKRVADASEPPVVIPVVVVAVDVHVALVVPVIERGIVCTGYHLFHCRPRHNLMLEVVLNFISHGNALVFCTKYIHFFMKCYIHHSISNLSRIYSRYMDTGFGSEKP
ncbi:MAG: hypothetical protein UT78_C0023G0005 [Candidatus Nomurabacteria bacterium GW2011_GWF2_40_12]|uniref:Uncharacterized protein n=1 Tax=Candidatus Nomurabacteria bacterium GW2011_GWF2_40_12 TaxID=1618776 RepID=A0A0G0QMJ1_9BACT|nr:MAG: hypothetical protein UT78_C0023G0005 [Candidatus Nomurabacteria bacterium GW2011_GWF2_40_12]